MARYFEFNDGVNFNRFGGPASVLDDNLAKFMYYLNCVCTVIEYDDDDMEQYTDYENYRWLTPYQRQRVFLLCKVLSPDEFEDRVFFENDDMCGYGSSNAFYKITQVRNQLMTVSSILIAGQRRNVKKIMTYKQSWMQNNYYEPMQYLEYEYNLQRRQQAAEQILSEACIIS
ncbi:unnamed protein product [Adineta steineri]|uniref:Uncharacterized protein n=1 Tax=Adineta steineri TaxID=433720 RepID=A0A818KYC3_9BILA|nr:unnamed protein product [Adineta steineri]CAF3565303.1 unnamed protein product [Adineta steineri]